MTPDENIQAVRRESAMLADAARHNLAPIVPSCPDWSVSDLVWHVGGIHRHRIWLITEHPDGPSGFEIERPKDAEIVEFFDTLLAVEVQFSDEPPKGNGETVHVHATDQPAEWVITLDPKGARAEQA